MTGLVRKAMLFGVCGLLAATTAFANVPSPGMSTVPDWVQVVGTQAGVVHPGKNITVTVRDFLGNAIPGSAVLFDFSGMVDVRLCTAVVAGTGTVNCGAATVLASSNASGVVDITILGGANNQFGLAPGHGIGAGQIFADGIPLGTFTSPTLNQDGAATGSVVNGGDIAFATADVNSAALGGPYVGRTDYSCDGTLTGADLAFLTADVNQSALGNGSGTGCNDGAPAPYCP